VWLNPIIVRIVAQRWMVLNERAKNCGFVDNDKE